MLLRQNLFLQRWFLVRLENHKSNLFFRRFFYLLKKVSFIFYFRYQYIFLFLHSKTTPLKKEISDLGVAFRASLSFIAQSLEVDIQNSCNYTSTVKLVYSDHPWDPKIVAVVDRWSEVALGCNSLKWDLKKVTVIGKWLLF